MKGYLSVVLHTHMPYVRKNGVWPVGEDWLYQVMANTYIPLLGMLSQLEYEGLTSCLTMTLTPILCEQLDDGYIKERFLAYLKTMAEHAKNDARDFEYFNDPQRLELAEHYHEDYRRKIAAFAAIDGDLLGAFAELERDGVIEIMGSSATHAFLPGLKDRRSVVNQVELGLDSHAKRFGKEPAGFWVPECAYVEGLEKLLAGRGVRYFLCDPSGIPELPSTSAYEVGRSGVSLLARSARTHACVWDENSGYPTDGAYLDTTKYYQESGLFYWRVTGPGVPIENKEPYEPDRAKRRAFDHARHFISEVTDEVSGAGPRVPAPGPARPPIVLASYDTELFGHGWREGILWLETVLRSLAASSTVRPTSPSVYLRENPPVCSTCLVTPTTWGTGNDYSTWINEETSWMWDRLGECQDRLFELTSRFNGIKKGPEAEALAQCNRELLLLESSDWPYMVAKDRAKTYAIERFDAHLERFRKIAGALEKGELDSIAQELDEIEEVDKIFI